jgi:hypothetical protein
MPQRTKTEMLYTQYGLFVNLAMFILYAPAHCRHGVAPIPLIVSD